MKMKKGNATTMKKRRHAPTPRACVQMWDLAGGLVPDLKETDSAWIMGAREILFGLLLHIQKTQQPGLTGEQMAREAARLVAEADYDELVAIMAREHPPGAALLMGRTNKTTASFLVQLAVSLSSARGCGHIHGPCG